MKGKGKKELLQSAPWRGDDGSADSFADAKLKATRDGAAAEATMHVPNKKSAHHHHHHHHDEDDIEIDPELRYTFQRNFRFLRQVFSVDTVVKPLPPAMAYTVSRNLTFFIRIFTQFWDPEGIANAQRSIGLGQEEKARRIDDD